MLIYKIKNRLSFALFLWASVAQAQSQPASHIEWRAGFGKLIPIYQPFPSSGLVSTLECSVFKRSTMYPSWRSNYARCHIGWSAQLLELGNPLVLGQCISVAPVADYIKHINDRSSFKIRISVGLGYFTKHFDAIKNPDNNVIGSALANVSRFQIEWRRQFHTQWRMGVGLHFIHGSNAHFAVPNVGANIVGAHLTLAKNKLPPKDASSMILLLIGYNKRWNIHAGAGYGWHAFEGTAHPADGPLYKDPVGYIQLGRVHRHRSTWYAGLQWTKYNSYKHFLIANELAETNEMNRVVQNYTLYLGYDWFFPHASFFIQSGIALSNPLMDKVQSLAISKHRNWLYSNTASKLGYRFYLFDPIKHHFVSPYLQLAVKTNGGTADFFETSIGMLVDW